MKKIIIFALLVFVLNINVFGKPSDLQQEQEEQALKRYEKLLDQRGLISPMWGNVDQPWIDGALLKILMFFDGIHLYFSLKVRDIAMICMALSIGIGAFKLIFGMVELNKLLVQLFTSLLMFMIILHIFPTIMSTVLKLTSRFASEAIFSYKAPSYNKYGVTKTGFENYIKELAAPDGQYMWGYYENEKFVPTGKYVLGMWKAEFIQIFNGTGFFAKSAYVENENSQSLRNMIEQGNMTPSEIIAGNVIDSKTGIVSFNRVIMNSLLVFKGLWRNVARDDFNISTVLADIILAVATSLLYLASMIISMGYYVTCLIQFGFLYSFGILFIPFMLWDGSKTIFEGLVKGIITITVHLLVKTMIIFMIILINVEILNQMYIMSVRSKGGDGPKVYLELFLTVIILSLISVLYAMQSSKIADFLLGGSPSIGFGELQQAARSTGQALGAGAKVSGGVAKLAGGAAVGTLGAVGAGVMQGAQAFKAERAAGQDFGQAMKSGALTAGKSMTGSLVHGAASAVDRGVGHAINGVRNFGSNMKSIGSFADGMLSGTGYHGGGHGHGGGSGSGGGKGDATTMARDPKARRQAMMNEYDDGVKKGEGHLRSLRTAIGNYVGGGTAKNSGNRNFTHLSAPAQANMRRQMAAAQAAQDAQKRQQALDNFNSIFNP